MGVHEQDTFLTGGRGSPNAWSPASNGANWTVQHGSSTLGFTGTEGTLTGTTGIQTLSLDTNTYTDIDVLVHSITDTNDTIGVVARMVDWNNYYRGDYNPVSGVLNIVMRKSGSETVLATVNVGQPTTPGWNLHFSIQGNAPNDLKLSWWDDNGEDDGWLLLTYDNNFNFRTAGLVGVYGNAGSSGDVLTYDSFVAQDPSPFPNPGVPPTNVPDSPYLVTIYVKTQTITFLPYQIILDMLSVAYGSWIRYQLQWQQIEPNANGVYNWEYLDWAVTLCNSYGLNILWPIQAPPSGYLTIKATDGSTVVPPGQAASTLTTALTSGVTTTSLQVVALTQSLANGTEYSIDTKTNAEQVLVSGNYSPGATTITVTNLNGNPWKPSKNHAIGTVTGTTGGQFASASAWATFVTAVCNRYNGTVNSPYSGYPMILNGIQLGNEEYDLPALGVPHSYPQGNILSQWLVPIANACYPIIRAALPHAYIGLNAVRKVSPSGEAHIQAWITNLYTYLGGLIAAIKNDPKFFLDMHYYRSGVLNYDGTLWQDPTTDTYNSSGGPIDCPSIQREVADIYTIIHAYGASNTVWCNENGWDLYNASTDQYASSSNVVSQAQDATWRQDMFDKLRLGKATHGCAYTLNPAANVKSKTLPFSPTDATPTAVQTSTEQLSLVQNISGVYTYMTGYTMWQNYAIAYPSWGSAQFALFPGTKRRTGIFPSTKRRES